MCETARMGAAYAGIPRRADQSQFPHTRLHSMEIESVRFEPVFRPITSRRENLVSQREEELEALVSRSCAADPQAPSPHELGDSIAPPPLVYFPIAINTTCSMSKP
jgi:hypothetical protein